MENEELNRKLAEWAGFKRVKYTTKIYKYPEGNSNSLPNFTESLDACFKWLAPKFHYDVLLSHAPDLSNWHCDILGKSVYIGEEKIPALALCKAIEKLIDNE